MNDILKPFDAGDSNKFVLRKKGLEVKPVSDSEYVEVTVPCRLHYAVLDLGDVYYRKPGGGGIALGSDAYQTKTKVFLTDNGKIDCSHPAPRHIASIMKHVMGFEEGVKIDIEPIEKAHCGFASTQGKIVSTAICINELFGNNCNPFSDDELRRLIADNYVEEKDDMVVYGLETGLAPLVEMYGGLIIADKNLDMKGKFYFPDSYKVLTYIPNKKRMKKNDALGFGHLDEADLTERVLKLDRLIVPRKMEIVEKEILPAILKGDEKGIITSLNNLTEIYYSNWVGVTYGEQIMDDMKVFRDQGMLTGMSSTGSAIFLVGKDDEIKSSGKYIDSEGLSEGCCVFGNISRGAEIFKNGQRKKMAYLRQEFG